VGSNVGVPVGELEGTVLGNGVDFPGRYVGSNVGSALGELVGTTVGSGVALPGR